MIVTHDPGPAVLFGTTDLAEAAAVEGLHTGSGEAILGSSHRGHGVHGKNGNGSGLRPEVGSGVLGESDNGFGAYASSGTNVGVFGESQTNNGVRGLTHSASAAAVAGVNKEGGIGIFGEGNPAGSFVGDVEVAGKVTAGDIVCPRIDTLEQRITLLEQQANRLMAFMDFKNPQPIVRRFPEEPPELFNPDRSQFSTRISGRAFVPNALITFRVADGRGFMDETQQLRADEHGAFFREISHPDLREQLFIAATDRRASPDDWTGFLWSNTVTV